MEEMNMNQVVDEAGAVVVEVVDKTKKTGVAGPIAIGIGVGAAGIAAVVGVVRLIKKRKSKRNETAETANGEVDYEEFEPIDETE